MSRNNRNDNNSEYIYIDTVSIKFIIKTKGDFITHELDLIPFHPNMLDIDRFTNSSQVLFPSFIKISQSDINNNSKIGASRFELFTHLDLYSKFITHLSKERVTPLSKTGLLVIDKNKNKNNDDGDNFKRIMVSSEYITKDEIIINNIGVIKNLFFPIDGKLFMLGHKFIITESRYVSHEASEEFYDYVNKTFKLPKSFTVIIELNILDATNNENIGNFSERSCIAKKISISKDIDEIFANTSSDYKSKIMMPINTLKTVMTTNRNFGKLLTEWERRNIFKQPPRTEREKLEFERGLTPLMTNKIEYDLKMAEINRLPQGYVTELNKLDEDIVSFNKKNEDIEYGNDSNSEYKKQLLKILFNEIDKSTYNVTTYLVISDASFSVASIEIRTQFITDIKKKVEEVIYDKYKYTEKPDTIKPEDKIKKLEKEFGSTEDDDERKEITSKLEKLRTLLASNTSITNDRYKWQEIVRSVDVIKKKVKNIEDRAKIEAIKGDNKKNIEVIENKIKEVYVKFQILNSYRKSDDDHKDKEWPYFIPNIYRREKTWENKEIPIDTVSELNIELSDYYKSYKKLQDSLNPSKRLNGSIAILRLQVKLLKEMYNNTSKILTDLNSEKNKINNKKDFDIDERYTALKVNITEVNVIIKKQDNLRKALDEVISKLTDVNASQRNKREIKSENEYIPSNDDEVIITNIIVIKQKVSASKLNESDHHADEKKIYTIEINGLRERIINKIDLKNYPNSIILLDLIDPEVLASKGGGNKLLRNNRFISKKNYNINKKKYNNTKKKYIKKTKKRNIKRVKFN